MTPPQNRTDSVKTEVRSQAAAAGAPSKCSVTPMIVDVSSLDDRWQRVPELSQFCARAVDAVAEARGEPFASDLELSLVFSDDHRIAELNQTFRGREGATNVLSFPAGDAPGPAGLLGDVILAYETIDREAGEQCKTFENHLCHLIVHGVLHLLGYDHLDDASARQMEGLEINALANLDVANPYERNV
jgi:probable rRNA maturation factor